MPVVRHRKRTGGRPKPQSKLCLELLSVLIGAGCPLQNTVCARVGYGEGRGVIGMGVGATLVGKAVAGAAFGDSAVVKVMSIEVGLDEAKVGADVPGAMLPRIFELEF